MISTQSVPCVYHIFDCVGYARYVVKSRSVTWFYLKYSWILLVPKREVA